MFRVRNNPSPLNHRLVVVGLLALSAVTLGVTVWVMNEFLHEQEIVRDLIRDLPPDSAASAQELAGELRWQFRLTALVILNLVITGLAVVLLWRAYRSSQATLRDVKALALDILDSMDLAVITTDLGGVVTSINRRAVEILSLADDPVGRPLASLARDLPLEEMRQESRRGTKDDLIRDCITTRGIPRTLRVFCQPLRNHENREIGNVVQLRDVTDQVLLDERMRRMERYMGLGSLAAGLHHEIKNPLAALSLHVQLLEEELEVHDHSDDVLTMLGVIKTEVTRVGGVLESFRDFASVAHLNPSRVDLRELIQRQVQLIGPQANQKGIRLLADLSRSGLPSVLADRIRIEQVLLNLLVNAMEAMPDGGNVTVDATPVGEEGEAAVKITVSDTGTGIPASIRESIFDPYFTTKSDGTGMGLALCDKIIRQHGGGLECESSPTGTTFVFTIPVGNCDLMRPGHE